MQHSFRLMTEAGTREGMGGPFFTDWGRSVGNMHGWSDGDPFLVNYIGHPLQGAVTNFVWIQNDVARYRYAEFGRSRDYWKSRLRATAWSWAYSTQFEIGPLSEASIGNVQNSWPQVGFVDHIVTPSMGLAWTLAEDALDRYIIRRFEDRVSNSYARLMVRSWLNPGRSMANILALRVPWARDTREGVWSYAPATHKPRKPTEDKITSPSVIAPFEFATQPIIQRYGSHTCLGGGANGAFRVAPSWQFVVDVSGCTLLGLGPNTSGDSLIYQFGPRWTPAASRRFSPYAEFLIGGHKITQSKVDPVKKQEWDEEMQRNPMNVPPPVPDYMEFKEANAFAMRAATGVDVRLTSAVALRLANLGYMRTWTSPINGVNYNNGFQFTSGVVLRMGTW